MIIVYEKICICCNEKFSTKKYQKKCCSDLCIKKKKITNGSKGGANSVLCQSRRSKNEIYFGELCKKKFNIVEFNKPIFNGWDADVIVEDFKIAILWNGKWHYEKITNSHSVAQVQNRDKIKIKEIIKLGYEPYIIKDMGRYKKKFVEEQFDIFEKHIAG